jgi:hypothetical protein
MQQNSRVPFHMALAVLVSIAGCSRQQPVPPQSQGSQTHQLPTATEIFNLRSKCAELAGKLDEEKLHGSAVEQDVVSNYSVKNNRCYVTLTTHPSLDLAGTSKWYNNVYLYDGQTRDLLASTNTKGNPVDPSASSKSGMVYGKGILGYDDTQAYIDKLMEREGENP